MILQIYNRIGNKLTGAMIGNIASPIYLDKLDIIAKQSLRHKHIAAMAVSAESIDGQMLY